MNKPDLHHDGPITIDLCQSIWTELDGFGAEIAGRSDNLDKAREDADWLICLANWIGQLRYAKSRIMEVQHHLEQGLDPDPQYHGKIVDICLCVIRDYKDARFTDFENPDYEPDGDSACPTSPES